MLMHNLPAIVPSCENPACPVLHRPQFFPIRRRRRVGRDTANCGQQPITQNHDFVEGDDISIVAKGCKPLPDCLSPGVFSFKRPIVPDVEDANFDVEREEIPAAPDRL